MLDTQILGGLIAKRGELAGQVELLRRAEQRGLVALHHETLADLVHHDEGALVLHVQVTAQLQCRQPLRGIAVDGDGADCENCR